MGNSDLSCIAIFCLPLSSYICIVTLNSFPSPLFSRCRSEFLDDQQLLALGREDRGQPTEPSSVS